MTREIKFRAWLSETNEMIKIKTIANVGIFTEEGEWFFDRGVYSPDKNIFDVTLMQYTGMKDSNGKEIYENDIVVPYKRSPTMDANSPFIVAWHDKYGAWYLRKVTPEYDALILPLATPLYKSIEVIGNIYENQKLLNSQ